MLHAGVADLDIEVLDRAERPGKLALALRQRGRHVGLTMAFVLWLGGAAAAALAPTIVSEDSLMDWLAGTEWAWSWSSGSSSTSAYAAGIEPGTGARESTTSAAASAGPLGTHLALGRHSHEGLDRRTDDLPTATRLAPLTTDSA
jgi:hypothetical protein